MKILFLSSEVAPFSKIGGLGDVSAALPAALANLGAEIKVVTPLYGPVPRTSLAPAERFRLQFPFGLVDLRAHCVAPSKGHEIIFLEEPALFERTGIYNENGKDYPDNHRRFAAFSIGALAWAQLRGFVPDVVHLNDWPTGLAALALRRAYRRSPLGSARVVFTIHNLAYQGLFSKYVIAELGLPWDLFSSDRLEFHGRVSFIKAGLGDADAITTVSRTYAKEILTPEYGEGLDGILRRRRDRIVGIINGIDRRQWDPGRDPYLPAHYGASDLSGKKQCKAYLQAQLRLRPESEVPLFSVISRLVPQKGIELLVNAFSYLLQTESIQLAVLGRGEPYFERALKTMADRHGGAMSVRLAFDEPLAHVIEGGSDFFVMPSMYEPCGLNQMYSLRYGTAPIVRATGGLEDTVIDISQPQGTGIKFLPYTTIALRNALQRAIRLYGQRDRLSSVQKRGMGQDFGWARSAEEYSNLYRRLIDRPTAALAQ